MIATVGLYESSEGIRGMFLGVICDRRMPTDMKGNIIKSIIRLAPKIIQIFTSTTYCSECWVGKKKEVNKLNSAKMKMIRCAKREARLDILRKYYIGIEAHIKTFHTTNS